MKKLAILALLLTGCQFNYTFPDRDVHKDASVRHTGHHGAAMGAAYRASVEACMLVKSEEECTDEEWVEEYQDIPGQGYYDGQWSADHSDEMAKDDGSGYHNSQMIAENADEVI